MSDPFPDVRARLAAATEGHDGVLNLAAVQEFDDHAIDDVTALLGAVDRVLELHTHRYDSDNPATWNCEACGRLFPCPTVKAIRGGSDE